MESEKINLRAYFDNTSVLIVVIDRRGHIVEFNPACQKITGYTLEEVSVKPFWDILLLPEEVENVREVFNALIRKEYPNEYENTWVTKDGSRRIIAWTNTVVMDDGGEVLHIVSSGIDVTEHRLTEKALRETEERYSRIFMDNLAPMILIDPDTGKIVNANSAALKFYKYSLPEIQKCKISDINILPASKLAKKMREARTQRHNSFVFKHRLADGQIRDVEVYSSPVNIDGHTYLFSIVHDITRRKQAEEETITISRFPEQDPNPVMRFSKDGRLLYANRASAALLKAWNIKLGDCAPVEWQEKIEGAYNSGRLREVDIDCENRVFSCILAPIIQDGYVNLYANDITSRVQIERERERLLLELENERRHWQCTVDSMIDPVVIYDASGKVTYTNDAYRQLICQGIEADLASIDDEYCEKFDFPNRTNFERFQIKASNGALNGTEVRNEELILSGKGGEAIHLVWNASPLHDVEGKVDGAVLVFHNITELEQARRELKRHAEYLERLNRDLTDFLYHTTHDLQEPMRKIRSFGELLEESLEEKLGGEELDHLRRMNRAARRMQTMLDQLLTYARITARPTPIERIDLNRLLDEVLVNLTPKIEQRRAKVKVTDLPCIEADYNQLVLLFQHLVDNALKFQRDYQRPEISIYCRSTTAVLETGETAVTLVVEDNGIGFDVSYLEKAFMPFQRLVGRSEYDGAGMGLTICRKIVEYHGGKISAESAPGKGARFIVQLPLRQRAS